MAYGAGYFAKEYIIIIIAYFIIINIIGWVLPYLDKRRAQKGKWRIREKTLFIVSALGGSVAMLASMKKYRHKTRHKRFMVGIPCIIFLQILLIGAAVYFLGIRG
ncbi:MAG: DUF1294 domain-containing protein [Oscillospiraceae bacterium]|nr:DUF1294 domain-containing protein [Oscillospiraceae bacterium]